MAGTYLYKLKPKSAFHFGDRGLGVEGTAESFRSDSLFSALCYTCREAWGQGEVEDLLFFCRDASGAPFTVSSCFPYAGDVLFFPRAMLRLPLPEDGPDRKLGKKVRYLSQTLFLQQLRGDTAIASAGECNTFQASRLLVHEDDLPGMPPGLDVVWAKDEVPRVTLDRASGASSIFRSGRLVFAKDCGLFFLVNWRDESLREQFESALALLGDSGIGGERSAGHGQFELLGPEPFELPAPGGAKGAVTLSLYNPTVAELANGVLSHPAAYDLVIRRGWMSSPGAGNRLRRNVRMIAEGSVLNAGCSMPLGQIVDVTPEGNPHPVFRSGLAFLVPATVGVEN